MLESVPSLLAEAGGVAARLDGTRYLAGQSTHGLLAAADPLTWDRARTLLS